MKTTTKKSNTNFLHALTLALACYVLGKNNGLQFHNIIGLIILIVIEFLIIHLKGVNDENIQN